ncbi:hypothetical protein [Streptosporangium sp. NPDC051022]|uniref:hypothetical protein n=1 Tax=Streptosporangium sp. NPDC051022 TaxID=3155752 RepID=UPI00341DD056
MIADQLLTSECMKRKGFKYRPNIPPRKTTPEYPAIDGDDVSARRHRGYDPDPRLSQEQDKDPNVAYIAKMPEPEQRKYANTLTGNGDLDLKVKFANGDEVAADSDGCSAEASVKLYGDQRQLLSVQVLAINVDAEAMSRARKDPAYLAKVSEWSACMTQGGMKYKTPDEAVDSALRQQQGESTTTARRREISIAAADATCDKKVGLSETERRLTGAYIEKVAHERSAEISTFTRMRDRALKIAASLMQENKIK